MINNTIFKVSFLLHMLVVLGCASSGPQTQFYSLFPAESLTADYARTEKNTSFGIGPVVLPEYLNNASLVSLDSTHQLRVSGYRAWAGNLDAAIPRVLSANLAQLWQIDGVWAFPWDMRARPDYQLRVVLEQFDGVRGGEVSLVARWQLIDQKKNAVVRVSSTRLSRTTADDSVEAYVATLNDLLTELSLHIAKNTKEL